MPVELVALRVTAIGATEPVIEERSAKTSGSLNGAIIDNRPAYFDGRWVDTPNYDRDRLAPGMVFDGPAIVLQYDTTTVVRPEHWVEVDEHGNLLIWPKSKKRQHS